MSQAILTNCRIVLAEEISENSSLLIEDGRIAAIDPAVADKVAVYDLNGAWLLPGLIDLHCDALEKEIEPRPGVFFPHDFALSQADRRNALAGISTVFHALSFAGSELGVRNPEMAATIARRISAFNGSGMVDNRVHCRYEITDIGSRQVLDDLLGEGAMHLLSMMDHTPGQGQFKDIAAYRSYLTRTYGKSANEADQLIEKKYANADQAMERLVKLARKAHAGGIVVASHDDDSLERVAAMTGAGVDISEFPINFAAAKAAKEAGMWTVFGAPNVVRGGSQSGSMKALDAILAGVADCLCSDYHPGTLLTAVFALPEQSDLTLPEAVALVSDHPAQAVGLNDRGRIEVGRRADLIAVEKRGDLPTVTELWCAGRRKYRSL